MKKTILALAIAGFALQASATVITFESLASPDDNVSIGTSYTESGFALNDITPASPANGFGTWGTSNYFFGGSTALFNNDYDGYSKLTQVGGGAFQLNAIDLTVMFPTVTTDGTDVTFIGTKLDNTTVTASFHVTDAGTQTFAFTGFTDLASVSWANDSNLHQFDNINVAAVPEPETYAMFMAGLAVIGGVARRRLPR